MAENSRARIMLLARRMRLLVWVVMVAAAGLYLGARLGVNTGGFQIIARGGLAMLSWIANDIAVVLLLAALWQLSGMLTLVANGERFSPPVTLRFRRFALLLLIAATITLLSPIAAVLLAPIPANHRIELPVNFRDIWTLLITGVLFLVASLLDEAQRLEADLEEIV